MTPDSRCPCGTGDTYVDCCGRWHAGAAAPSAEALMRSRFTAFAFGNADFLLQSWHSSTRPAQLELDDRIEWTRLDILSCLGGGPFATTGTVEFRAHHRIDGARASVHERSEFVREDGRWFYLTGVPPA